MMALTPVQCRGKVLFSLGEQGRNGDEKNVQALRAFGRGGECPVYMPELREDLHKNRCRLRATAGGVEGGGCGQKRAARSIESGTGWAARFGRGVFRLVPPLSRPGNAAFNGGFDVRAGVLPGPEILHCLDGDQLGIQGADVAVRAGWPQLAVARGEFGLTRFTLLTRRWVPAYANPAAAKSAAGFGDSGITGGHAAILSLIHI